MRAENKPLYFYDLQSYCSVSDRPRVDRKLLNKNARGKGATCKPSIIKKYLDRRGFVICQKLLE